MFSICGHLRVDDDLTWGWMMTLRIFLLSPGSESLVLYSPSTMSTCTVQYTQIWGIPKLFKIFFFLIFFSLIMATLNLSTDVNSSNKTKTNLKCPCFLFRYPKLDISSQALFNLHRASALPLWCGSEYDQNFQIPPGHLRLSVTRRQYTMVLMWQGDQLTLKAFWMNNSCGGWTPFGNRIRSERTKKWLKQLMLTK